MLKKFAKGSSRVAAIAVAAAVLGSYAASASAEDVKVVLEGKNEVPPVTTSALGNGTITVGDDKSVKGSVSVSGLAPTMAHIHEAAAGSNGPVIIPLTKVSDNTWTVPAGAKLTDEQYKSFKAGNLYVNFHTDANKGGEIRAQIKP